MKKTITLLLTLVLAFGAFTARAPNAKGFTIAIPNDPTNEARALRLLETNGLITIADSAGELATKLDIADNPYGIEITEVDAAQAPSLLKDVDYAVINSNFAAGAGLNPAKDSLIREPNDSPYANVLAGSRFSCIRCGNTVY